MKVRILLSLSLDCSHIRRGVGGRFRHPCRLFLGRSQELDGRRRCDVAGRPGRLLAEYRVHPQGGRQLLRRQRRHRPPLPTGGGGPTYWIGAGPTYGYVTFQGLSDSEWGWDANAGVAWTMGGVKPYAVARYYKIKDFRASGASIGLRF